MIVLRFAFWLIVTLLAAAAWLVITLLHVIFWIIDAHQEPAEGA